MLKSKPVKDDEFKPGTLVQICLKNEEEKHGKCTGTMLVLDYDKTLGTMMLEIMRISVLLKILLYME